MADVEYWAGQFYELSHNPAFKKLMEEAEKHLISHATDMFDHDTLEDADQVFQLNKGKKEMLQWIKSKMNNTAKKPQAKTEEKL